MDNYIVSARKYRPSNFKSVVGQSHITTTLQNAIRNNQIAQAFLFCGPRGVGKTTCARILAKTINCTNLTQENEACNECESCKSFNTNSSFNIFELDAASNNSVEDIRTLVDQVRIPPQGSHYKVYIIDEVHMLSSAAFNAFLKTLEEPPPYAKFILATTEKHKIIPTILSRCQIFDFHRILNEDITNHLEYIAKIENIEFDKQALHIIAEKSDGGLRDALSMFDQLVSFTRGNLSYENIIENLNILDYDYYFKIVDHILECDIPKTLLVFNDILDKGFEGLHFINGLASHFRNLLVCKDESTIKLLDISDELKNKYISQARKSNTTFILRALDFANTSSIEYKESSNRRLCIEISLLKMANIMNKINPTSIPEGQEKKKSEPIVEEEKPIIKTQEKPLETKINIPKRTSISINADPNETLLEIEKLEKSKVINLDYNLFLSIWDEIAEEFKEKNPNLYFTFKNSELVDNQDNSVTIKVLNSFQEAEINNIKYELTKQIKQKTNCENFQLITHVAKVEKKSIIYMPRDKYEFLKEKQPNLIKLRAEFDLDIDF
ncbi:MAG: DNA polymerase III subunit gamma/tau [Bacteroidales bacterium]|jgi:DNA polymerase-3 subunit gamma/tau|nr:DNA polymerase III subunit gamma/tau [Bacteroidales bacterium]MDD3724374.1 DNA polymerase III subunit gamma/tau [Bacteroidales bacterium]MDD4544641.1 DNA polymerase III subunit gamma/tau [Bacteroidales bacterium]MDY0053935.1 DNA polymerase III subunit gamma/tau [Bacteroidales bacterium]